jgi:DNA-binding MarR family transcriptional regulator
MTAMQRDEVLETMFREKHDGELEPRADVRVWLRMLSCTIVIEKRLRRRFIEQFETTLPRFDVMAALERHADGMTMGELSNALLVSNGNVTAIVRQLERDGYAVSRPAPGDRRSSIVALTSRGRTDFAVLAEAHHEWIKQMLAGMSSVDKAALHDLLQSLKSSIASDKGSAK